MKRNFSFYFFKPKPIKLGDEFSRWRAVAELLNLKAEERLRVEWMIFYYKEAKRNATQTCRHFGISRKTFYKWLKRFKESKENVESLRDLPKRPLNTRKWEVTPLQEERIKQLRKTYLHYGKQKLKVLYRKIYQEEISCWKIERVIRRYKLYPDKIRAEKIARKQAKARERPKKRIQKLKKEKRIWFLFHLDTIVIYCGNLKRYILTAVDYASKFGYARMYRNKSSKVARDFLYRLQYVINQPIENIQTDNGSEFAHYFEEATKELKIERYFSRVKTPKDNPEAERFNETLEYEWLYDGNLDLDCERFNKNLTEWLIEYNFNRPHKSLDYLAPMEYIEEQLPRIRNPAELLPMWSARTTP